MTNFQTHFKYIVKGFRHLLYFHNIEMPKNAKNAKIFECIICDFQCTKLSNYNNHISTRKHQLEINGNFGIDKTADNYECDICSKEFKTNSGLWKHKRKCSIAQAKEISNTNDISVTDIDKEVLIKMLLKNQDIMEGVILKNSDVMDKMIEMMPNVMDKMIEMMPNMGMNISNNNTNSHNTTNNQFNIQMFLNDHCKNAMNLTDFIQSLPITSETYDSTIENGLTKTITSMMLNGLNDLDILERPIHCTDATRKTLYVKDSDKWEKDNELIHILNGIKELSLKQRTLISKWREVNEGWKTDENLQSKMTNLVFNSMTQIESDEKETGKIIRSISKKVYLDNETKEKYT